MLAMIWGVIGLHVPKIVTSGLKAYPYLFQGFQSKVNAVH